jgi:membrane associated rhomboid family serine protease
MSIFQDFRSHARQSLAPATVAICVGLVFTFLLAALRLQPNIGLWLAFFTDFSQPWGLVTYPFAYPGDGSGLIWLVLEVLWLWGMGGSVERDLGTPKYVALFLAFTLLGALSLALGAAVVGASFPVIGPLIPIGAITVVWGTRNPTLPVMLMMIIPILGRWLAWLTAAIVFFNVTAMYNAPLVGAFGCVALFVGWLFASNRIPGVAYSRGAWGPDWGFRSRGKPTVTPSSKKTDYMSQEYYDDVRRREQERAERERLKKLFEGSLDDDAK